jgi:hypothetical protein
LAIWIICAPPARPKTATPSLAKARGPERGDVIEFSYLWAPERAAGLLEGVKDRRCVIVAVLDGARRAGPAEPGGAMAGCPTPSGGAWPIR